MIFKRVLLPYGVHALDSINSSNTILISLNSPHNIDLNIWTFSTQHFWIDSNEKGNNTKNSIKKARKNTNISILKYIKYMYNPSKIKTRRPANEF